MRVRFVRGFGILLLTGCTFATLCAQSLVWLGVPEGVSSVATTVSDDGIKVVVRSGDILGGSRSSNSYLLDRLTNTYTQLTTNGGTAWGMTPDGAKIVGTTSHGTTNQRLFFWTAAGGISTFNTYSGGICITPDGTLAGGQIYNPNYPALWDTTVSPPQLLHAYTDRGYPGEIEDLSDDKSVALCYGVSGSANRARIWRMNGLDVVQDIVLQPYSGDPYTLAVRLSSDGTIAVGQSGQVYHIWTGVGSNYRAAMWRAANNWQVEPLATLGGVRGFAWDVNAGVIVGFCSTPDGENRAVSWKVDTATTQVEDLNQRYAHLLTDGSRLRMAFRISRDGRYIVGAGNNAATGRYEAFLLDTWRTGDTNGDGCIDDSDLLAVLFAFGTPGTGYTRHEDINKDGVVDDADLLIVLFNFGSGC